MRADLERGESALISASNPIRFIQNIPLEISPEDGAFIIFLKNFARFAVNLLYGFALRGNIFSSILLISYLAITIRNKQAEVDDFDFTDAMIAGSLVSTIFIILETIIRYANQSEQKQLRQKEGQLKLLNDALENSANSIDTLRMKWPLIIHLRNEVATLNPNEYRRYEFPSISPLRLNILDQCTASDSQGSLSAPTRKKYFTTTYKILVGLAQVFPQSIIASLLFSYLFSSKILKTDPFAPFNLISSILLASITGILVVLLNLSQRSGVEATIADQRQSIVSLNQEIQVHHRRLTELQRQWQQFNRDYQAVVVTRLPTMPQDALPTAARSYQLLCKEAGTLNSRITLFNQQQNTGEAAVTETRIGINADNENTPLLAGARLDP